MCISKKDKDPRSPLKEKNIYTDPGQPRSPWAKIIGRQNVTRRLPRKIAPSSKVNLNKYWNKFGEIINNQAPTINLQTALEDDNKENNTRLQFLNFFNPIESSKSWNQEEEENKKNVMVEHRFELLKDSRHEIDENFANEIREICFAQRSSCSICRN